MSRTYQEFKEEVYSRSAAYRKARRKRRQRMTTAILCLAVCIFALTFFPAGGKSENAAVNEMAPQLMDTLYGAGQSNIQDPAESVLETNNRICITIAQPGSAFEELSSEDAQIILDALSGQWSDDVANCACDYIFIVDGVKIYYHSECGTFLDMAAVQSLTIPEEIHRRINEILEEYSAID